MRYSIRIKHDSVYAITKFPFILNNGRWQSICFCCKKIITIAIVCNSKVNIGLSNIDIFFNRYVFPIAIRF